MLLILKSHIAFISIVFSDDCTKICYQFYLKNVAIFYDVFFIRVIELIKTMSLIFVYFQSHLLSRFFVKQKYIFNLNWKKLSMLFAKTNINCTPAVNPDEFLKLYNVLFLIFANAEKLSTHFFDRQINFWKTFIFYMLTYKNFRLIEFYDY